MEDPFFAIKPQFPEQEQLKCPRCESTNTKFCYYNNYNLSQPRHFCKNCRRYWTKGGTLRNIPVGGGSRKNTKRPSNPKRQNTSQDNFPTRNNVAGEKSRTLESSSLSSPQSVSSLTVHNSGVGDSNRVFGLSIDHQDHKMLDMNGSFSSLLTSNGQFGSLLEGLNSNGSAGDLMEMGEFGRNLNLTPAIRSESGRNLEVEMQSTNVSDGYLGIQSGDSSCWGGGSGSNAGAGNGWPDLSIFTPGSTFQ